MKSVGTLQVTGVDFVVLPTSNFEAAIAFYDNTLGFRRSVYRRNGSTPSSRPAT
jgi:hypothetical protein